MSNSIYWSVGTHRVHFTIPNFQMVFSHVPISSRLQIAGQRPADSDRFREVSAKFNKTIWFLRYCPTWPKNWCVRLNPRAHFTRYRSEPIDVLGIFIHIVCNALFFYNWRPTAVQASPVVVFFLSATLFIGKIIGSIRLTIDRFESHVKRPSFKVRRRQRSDTRLVLLKLIVACAHDEYIASTHTVCLSRFYRFVNIHVIRAFGQARI